MLAGRGSTAVLSRLSSRTELSYTPLTLCIFELLSVSSLGRYYLEQITYVSLNPVTTNQACTHVLHMYYIESLCDQSHAETCGTRQSFSRFPGKFRQPHDGNVKSWSGERGLVGFSGPREMRPNRWSSRYAEFLPLWRRYGRWRRVFLLPTTRLWSFSVLLTTKA